MTRSSGNRRGALRTISPARQAQVAAADQPQRAQRVNLVARAGRPRSAQAARRALAQARAARFGAVACPQRSSRGNRGDDSGWLAIALASLSGLVAVLEPHDEEPQTDDDASEEQRPAKRAHRRHVSPNLTLPARWTTST